MNMNKEKMLKTLHPYTKCYNWILKKSGQIRSVLTFVVKLRFKIQFNQRQIILFLESVYIFIEGFLISKAQYVSD